MRVMTFGFPETGAVLQRYPLREPRANDVALRRVPLPPGANVFDAATNVKLGITGPVAFAERSRGQSLNGNIVASALAFVAFNATQFCVLCILAFRGALYQSSWIKRATPRVTH
jgi:hypothetical protein